MMKQTVTFTVLKKIIIVFGVCIIPSINPVLAQSNNDQITTLLEIQALREEVAELRDMVERQQYEMQNLTTSLESFENLESSEKKPNSRPSSSSNFGSASGIKNSASTQNDIVSGSINNGSINSTSSVNPAGQSTIRSTRQSTSLNYQNGTGRLSVPAQGAVSNTITQNSGLNNVRQPGSVVLGTSGVLTNGAIDASNIQSPTDRNSANSTIRRSANTAIGNASTTTRSTTPVTNSTQRTTLSGTGIKPVETIQPGSSTPSNLAQRQQGVTSQVSNLNTLSENDYYQQGFGLLKESKHNEAVTVFQKQIKQYPQGELADDAYYWVAESLYVTRKLDVSKENFRTIIQSYPNSERAPDARLKLAYIEQEQGNIIESRILLQEIIQFHPQSDAALSAKNRLSQIN